jgi:hypothetical protein
VIGAALEGQVEMGHDLGVGAEDGEEVGGEVAGFEAGEAEAKEVGDLRAEGVDEVGQGLAGALGLAAAEGGGLAVGAQEDAGEDQFEMAGVYEAAGFGDGIGDGFAPETGAEAGNDAVGAMGVAAVLDFEEGALVGVLAGVEKGEGGGMVDGGWGVPEGQEAVEFLGEVLVVA